MLFLSCRANLSRDYFVDRQDRYTWFKNCPQLTNYFAELVSTASTHSFSLSADGVTEPPVCDPLSSQAAAREFRDSLNLSVSNLIQAQRSEWSCEGLTNDVDTLVFPLLQMGYYGIRQDEECTEQLLSNLGDGDKLCLASGYFNLPSKYIDAILQGKGHTDILAASPQVCQYTECSHSGIYSHTIEDDISIPYTVHNTS